MIISASSVVTSITETLSDVKGVIKDGNIASKNIVRVFEFINKIAKSGTLYKSSHTLTGDGCLYVFLAVSYPSIELSAFKKLLSEDGVTGTIEVEDYTIEIDLTITI